MSENPVKELFRLEELLYNDVTLLLNGHKENPTPSGKRAIVREIFAHIDKTSGEGLNEIVLTALRTHRKELGG